MALNGMALNGVRHDKYLYDWALLLSQVGLSMARLPRYVIPGQPQHIIQRGNNRQAIFAAEADYQFFRDALADAADGLAWPFMPMCG